MKSQPIANIVLDYFQVTKNTTGATNEILQHYVETCGENSTIDLKKARHAIYLKVHRLVKSGHLIVQSRKSRIATFALSSTNMAVSQKPKETSKLPSLQIVDERDLLTQRKAELEYELGICIAEAQDYEEMKALIPSQSELLSAKKNEAKQRAIKLNGQLTSTQTILLAMPV